MLQNAATTMLRPVRSSISHSHKQKMDALHIERDNEGQTLSGMELDVM